MKADKYKIVFRGEIQAGKSLEEVKRNMAGIFKLDPERIDILFSGKPVVMKKNLDHRQALKFKDAIQKAGAECHVLMDGASPALKNTPASPAEKSREREGRPAPQASISGNLVMESQEHGASRPVSEDSAVQLTMESGVSDKPWAAVLAAKRKTEEAGSEHDPDAVRDLNPIIETYRPECSGPHCFLTPDIPQELFGGIMAGWEEVSYEDALALIIINKAPDESLGMILTDGNIYIRGAAGDVRIIPFEESEKLALQSDKKGWVLKHGSDALFKDIPSEALTPLVSFIALCRQIAAYDHTDGRPFNPDAIVMEKARLGFHPSIIIKDEETRIEALMPYQFDPRAMENKLNEGFIGAAEARKAMSVFKTRLIPERNSTYKPSGKITMASVLLMIPAVIAGAAAGIGFMWASETLAFYIFPYFFQLGYSLSAKFALAAIVGGILYYLVINIGGAGFVIGKVVHWIVRLGGARSAGLGALGAAISAAICAAYHYLYYRSLKVLFDVTFPSDLPYTIFVYGFPVLGLLMIVVAGNIAHESVEEDKFCEVKGVFLKKFKSDKLDAYAIPAFFQALMGGDYKALLKLPKQDDKKKPYFVYTLHLRSNPHEFGVGYLEAAIKLRLDYWVKESSEKTDYKEEKWRFLSQAYDSREITRMGRAVNMIH